MNMNTLTDQTKRAPVTGTRVVRNKQGDVRSPQKGSSSGTFGASSDEKKRRPYTTPSRPSYETKRDPNTPTRTVRPYRPNTGGRDRLTSPDGGGGGVGGGGANPGMLTIVEDDDPIGVMGRDEYMSEEVEEYTEIEWVDEEAQAAATAAVPAAQHAPSPKPRKPNPSPAHLDLALANTNPQPVNFGKDGCKVRTGSKTLIGKGSFGCVFKGLHEGTNQIVAIKEIHLSGESAGKVNMIKKEIQLMKRLNHPNIVRYLGAERVKTQLHIYLEFVTGGSMASLVKEYGPLTEDMTRKYSRQVLDGLHYLHQNNIVHRDIKGDNLLVGTDGTVKLADFGTSKELRTLAATVTGTACFMAPEVIKGTGHGLASDVWSLGCAVIEMLNGRPPFSTFENQYATMMHVAGLKSSAEAIPEEVDELSKDFLQQCLQVDPNGRHTTPQLLQSVWFTQHPEDLVSQTSASVNSSAPLPPPQTAPHPFSLSGPVKPSSVRPQPHSRLMHVGYQGHAQSSASSRGASGSSRSHASSDGSRGQARQGFGTLPRAPLSGDSDVDSVKISHSGSEDEVTEDVEDHVRDFNPMDSYTGE